MKNNISLILFLVTYHPLHAQPRIGFEQYYCTGSATATTPVTRFYYQQRNNWYVEGRYNYDAVQTAGISAGRSFGNDPDTKKGLAWSVTPTVGWMTGRSHGTSIGTNLALDYHGFYFSSTLQASAAPAKDGGYWYNWAEIGKHTGSSLVLGIALLQDCRYGSGCTITPGIEGQFLYHEWSFPVYIFNPLDNRVWLLLGVTREWGLYNRKIANLKKPPISQ
jgi:hypothetical protein